MKYRIFELNDAMYKYTRVHISVENLLLLNRCANALYSIALNSSNGFYRQVHQWNANRCIAVYDEYDSERAERAIERRIRLRERVKRICTDHKLEVIFNTDPRGWSVYVRPKGHDGIGFGDWGNRGFGIGKSKG